jgi:ATP-dependent Lon protease
LKFKEIDRNRVLDLLEDAEEGDAEITPELPILPLRNTVVYPGLIVPLAVGRRKSVEVVNYAVSTEKVIGIITQKDPNVEDPGEDDLFRIGCAVQVLKFLKLNDGSQTVIVRGTERFRVVEYIQREPCLKVRVDPVEEIYENELEISALMLNLRELAEQALELSPSFPPESLSVIRSIEDPGHLCDLITSNLSHVGIYEKQSILEEEKIRERLKRVIDFLDKEIQVLKLSRELQSQVKGEMDRTQRDYYLREQLKAIQRELGEEDERAVEIDDLRAKVAEANMPEEVREVAHKELNRLAKIPPASAEYTVSRTYIDWLIDLPWSKSSKDQLDITLAARILDEDHYDLRKVKNRILEYLAVRKLKGTMKGPILCFVGPPGVGKTSLGRSIARAMGRAFFRLSLGGVRDEAEIRGHRRTYVGALPGRIIQGLKKAGKNNPVFMLDEVDKIGADFRGDPSSALLEVLDTEQNYSFSDHYLEVPFDLSKTMFIATANILDTIPPALRDRMEVLELPGYTEEEKLVIARQYLIPKQLDAHGLTGRNVRFHKSGVSEIIRYYTREAGVRNLEREIAAICRGVAKRVTEGHTQTLTISSKVVADYLGPQRFYSEVRERTAEAGVATGMAWTQAGGDIIFVEATRMKGKGVLNLTGHLGEVMRESAQAALSYVRANAGQYGIDDEVFQTSDIHIHVPAGAIPKDGPSAGLTIFCALVSLLLGRPVRSDVSMTGEITLRGMVLPVGGIKEKVLAAKRAGIRTVIIPEKNRKDLEEIPKSARRGIEFRFVQRMDEVIGEALREGRSPTRPGRRRVRAARPVSRARPPDPSPGSGRSGGGARPRGPSARRRTASG